MILKYILKLKIVYIFIVIIVIIINYYYRICTTLQPSAEGCAGAKCGIY